MDEAIRTVEEKEGIRLTWNSFSNSKNETAKNIIPLVVSYKAMHGYHNNSLLKVGYPAIRCTKADCSSALSMHSSIDFGSKHWGCMFCGRMNMLPVQYRGITQDNLPYELSRDSTTVFYKGSRITGYKRNYWFVIDLCSFDDERHLLLKDGLLTALDGIGEDDHIGIIRYSANIEIISLENLSVRKVHVFPAVDYTPAIIQKAFMTENGSILSLSKFTRRKGDCREYVEKVFKSMQINPFPVPAIERAKRCTGSAIQLASSIILSTVAEGTGHMVLFTQGPCTYGPGSISSLSLKQSLRTTGKEIAKFFSRESIYEIIANSMGAKGHVIDIIAAGIDDFGFAEMRSLVEKTAGTSVFARDFNPYIYKESIKRIFMRAEETDSGETPPMKRVFNAKTTAKISKGYRIKTSYGHGFEENTDKKQNYVWRQGSLFERSTSALSFEQIEDAPAGGSAFVQICTKFTDSSGESYERITTLSRTFCNSASLDQLMQGFDQEAACVYKAKELSVNADNGDGIDVIRQADRCLIRFMQRFCNFQRDSSASIKVPTMMSFFPEFMFFLRRLPALHTDGLSLDEVAYQRTILLNEDSPSTMRIIRPSLVAFHYTGERCPVELDSRSLKPDVALLVDTFHDVVIWYGANIATWIRSGVKDDPQYWFFKDMLNSLEKEAKDIVDNRLPVPKLTHCNQYSSQERILLCKVNPASSVANSVTGEGQTIVTEDIDFARFYDYLIKLVVAA